MDVAGFLAIARRWWSTILIATWVAGLAGYVTASGVPPTYEGQARMLVGPVVGDTNVLRGAASVTSTYAELVGSQPVIDEARNRLGLSPEVPWVVEATADETTRILVIRAQHGDAEVAAAMVNALAEALQELTASDVAIPEGELTVIEPAAVPTIPVSPQVTLITIIAAAAGLVGSTVLVLLIEYLANTVSTLRDLADVTDVPVLGFTALGRRFRPTREAPIIVDAQPDSRAAAGVRLVATKFVYTDAARPMQTILSLGTARRDGAADLAANVAAVLARSGRKTLLIDANDDDGELSEILGFVATPGLSDILQGGTRFAEAIIRRGPTLDFISAGLAEGVYLFDADVARQLVEQLRPRYELIVVNTAPIDRSGNTLVWARVLEGTVLVAERDRTKRDDLKYALDHLAGVGARILGAVMVDHPPHIRPSRQNNRRRDRNRRDVAPNPTVTSLARPAERRHQPPTGRPQLPRETRLQHPDEAPLE